MDDPAEGSPEWLRQRTQQGRDIKARRIARRIWDTWAPHERAGPGVAALKAKDPQWWRELATSLGEKNAPSPFTVDLIIAKLEQGAAIINQKKEGTDG